MKEILKQILFSPTRFSVGELHRRLIDREFTRDELAGVLGGAVADVVQNPPHESYYPSGGENRVMLERANQIVFWGQQGCGKSSVIASLLSLPGMRTEGDINDQRMHDRLDKWRQTFAATGPQVLPKDRSMASRAYNAIYTREHRTYHLTLIEANTVEDGCELIGSGSLEPVSVVHVFCLDCRDDLDAQTEAHEATIRQLKEKGIIDKSSGLYILVTKADLMLAPKVYLDNAAQAMVTASAQRFWQSVRKTCGESDIYNEQPIVCSIGDFALRDYTTLTTEYTSRLLDRYILPKCEHVHWGVVRWLRKMSRTAALVCLAVVAIAAAAGIYQVLDSLSQPPTPVIQPFDYKVHFCDEVARALPSGSVYDEGLSQQYWRLRYDLKVEHELCRADNERVLAPDDYAACDARLSDAFALIVNKKMRAHFNTGAWTRDSALLALARKDLRNLDYHKDNLSGDNAERCREHLSVINQYYDSVAPLVRLSKNCRSEANLTRVKSHVGRWKKVPFTNDTTLSGDLDNAVYNAYNSLSSCLLDSAELIRRKYGNLSYWQSDERIKLKQKAGSLDKIVKELQGQLENAMDDEIDYSTVRQRLSYISQQLYYIKN